MDEKKLSKLNNKLRKFKDAFSSQDHKHPPRQKESLDFKQCPIETTHNTKSLNDKPTTKEKPIDKSKLEKLDNKLKKFKDVFDEKDHKPATWQQECQNFKQHQLEVQSSEKIADEKSHNEKSEELTGYMEELSRDDEHIKQIQLTYNKLMLKHTQLQDDHIRLQGEHLRLQEEYINYLKSENSKLKK